MKQFLGILFVLVIVVVGLGFYLGWFRVSTDHDDRENNATITVNREKIHEDADKAKARVQEFGRKVKEDVNSVTTSKSADDH